MKKTVKGKAEGAAVAGQGAKAYSEWQVWTVGNAAWEFGMPFKTEKKARACAERLKKRYTIIHITIPAIK